MTTTRKAIPKKLRFDIFKRDNWTCRYCGATPQGRVLQVDHVVPVSKGGGNEPENLVTACQPCNIGKGVTGVDEDRIPIDPDATDEMAERAEQLRGYRKHLEEFIAESEKTDGLIVGGVRRHLYYGEVEIGSKDERSILKFVESLGFERVCELATVAQDRGLSVADTFRYFCGCCWNAIKKAEADETPF